MRTMLIPSILMILLAGCGTGTAPQPSGIDIKIPASPGNMIVSISEQNDIQTVELYFDNDLKLTDSSAPFKFEYFLDQQSNGGHKLSIKIIKSNGNVDLREQIVNINVTSIYQGKYDWVFFSDKANPDASIIEEGKIVFAKEYLDLKGNMIALGFTGQNFGQSSDTAQLGDVYSSGRLTLIIIDRSNQKLRLIAVSNSAELLISSDKSYFIAGASSYKEDGTIIKNGYFLMRKTDAYPY